MHSIIFFGSDRYSTVVLDHLSRSGIGIFAIITTQGKPDKKSGQLIPNPVEKMAKDHNQKVLYYPSNKEELNTFNDTLINWFDGTFPDDVIGLSASFPHLLPPSLIRLFRGQLYNIHPSLLPQYRNVAPVPYALAMGDKVTGVSIFQISDGIDNGQIVAQKSLDIEDSDTTPILLNKLFNLSNQLFQDFLTNPNDPSLTNNIKIMSSAELIFTRKLTRETGYIEWSVLQKLINDESITITETANLLLKLRLSHHPDRQVGILPDLIRAMEGYEKVWTTVNTKKGNMNISIFLHDLPSTKYLILIPGKPRPIPYVDFAKYYL